MSDVERIFEAIESLREKLARLEGKVDALFAPRERHGIDRGEARGLLRSLTAKQHATSQLIVMGLSDGDMAKRLVVSPNTVKLHVRALMVKLRVSTRPAVAAKVAGAMDALDPAEYRSLAYGLPKNWGATWADPDPYFHIYGVKRGE